MNADIISINTSFMIKRKLPSHILSTPWHCGIVSQGLFKGKENGKIRMKVSVIDILYYCSMCM